MTIEEIRTELAKQGKIALIWDVSDVQTVREDLNDEQAMEVLLKAERNHDAGRRVTWDTLEDIAEQMFGAAPDDQVEEDEQ